MAGAGRRQQTTSAGFYDCQLKLERRRGAARTFARTYLPGNHRPQHMPIRHPEGVSAMLSGASVGDLYYRRCRFSTKLMTDRVYTPSQFWVKEHYPGCWRVGLTKFAARMLGDVVDVGFETAADA